MVFKRTKPHIVLKPEEKTYLDRIVKSGKSEKREYDRTSNILMDSERKGASTIAGDLHINGTRVNLVIDKAISFGIEIALKDLPGRGRNRIIGDDARGDCG